MSARGKRYEHVREIASGGMGRVDLVARVEGAFKRVYAMKRMHARHVGDSDFANMFLDEARFAGLVRHPNVVSVIDLGTDDEGPFMVMEYVDGLTLARVLKATQARDERLPLQVCLRIAHDIASGLAGIHGTSVEGGLVNLVHRDVSPQNILLGFDGLARLTDFGIAKGKGRTAQTSTGVLKGKLSYMAPELLRLEDATPLTDLFALGVVLYEALTSRRIYPSRERAEIARSIHHAPPPDLGEERDVPAALEKLYLSLLAKNAADRPQGAAEVADTLRALIEQCVADEGIYSLA
ncbi:MAG: serine/threonine-protein kinase, partial [Myxococcota bacterium]